MKYFIASLLLFSMFVSSSYQAVIDNAKEDDDDTTICCNTCSSSGTVPGCERECGGYVCTPGNNVCCISDKDENPEAPKAGKEACCGNCVNHQVSGCNSYCNGYYCNNGDYVCCL